MKSALLEAFRYNTWATKELLSACISLSDEQLGASATGSYGDIAATFGHLVLAEGNYLRRLSGDAPKWVLERDESTDLKLLGERIAELEPLWERLLSQPLDADRLLILDDGEYEANVSVVLTQALNHGNVHREQVCAILTGLGIEPPEIDAWAWGEATGGGRVRTTRS